MHSHRHRYHELSRATLARFPYPKLAIFLLIVIIPGALVLPICYGIYGAIRHSFSGRVAGEAPGPDSANPLPKDIAQVGR
jgi:hypothetical protein